MKKFEINYWQDHSIKDVIIVADTFEAAIEKFKNCFLVTSNCIKLIVQIS
tara:strand:+ start:283 stop:432 length:150 start_codon:yes stop_codon:yes gene_type:complete